MGAIKKSFGLPKTIVTGTLNWLEDRTGLGAAIEPILSHKVPRTTELEGWPYVLGSATLTAFLIQVVTGIALATSYVSSTSNAYDSLQFISHQALFGHLLRGMHDFGASAMVLLIGLHALHVFLIGSYKFPREVNWLSGVLLLLMTLAMAFTGQLLRWDDTAVWSVVVGAEQAGRVPLLGTYLAHFIFAGDTVGAATLSRFFAFHVFFIPAIIFGLLGLHLYLVIRNGISEPPKRGESVDPKTYRTHYHEKLEKDGVPFWPDAMWRDAVGAILVIVAVVLLGYFIGAPELGNKPDPTILSTYPRPDWYFLWYFSVLAMIPSSTESFVIVFGPLLAGVVMIGLPFFANKGERDPLRRPWAMGFVLILLLMIGTLWVIGEVAPWSPKIEVQALTPAQAQVTQTSGPVYDGLKLFYSKGCESCHMINGQGGLRGPDLSYVADRYTTEQLTYIILAGRGNMPSYGNNMQPQELQDILAFLETRKSEAVQPTVPVSGPNGAGNTGQ